MNDQEGGEEGGNVSTGNSFISFLFPFVFLVSFFVCFGFFFRSGTKSRRSLSTCLRTWRYYVELSRKRKKGVEIFILFWASRRKFLEFFSLFLLIFFHFLLFFSFVFPPSLIFRNVSFIATIFYLARFIIYWRGGFCVRMNVINVWDGMGCGAMCENK